MYVVDTVCLILITFNVPMSRGDSMLSQKKNYGFLGFKKLNLRPFLESLVDI